MSADIETKSSRVVYENQWMRVREDEISRRDGSRGIYGVVEKPDFAVIVPVEDDCRLHLVEQFRYPVGGRYWELPQGAWEEDPQADPLTVARGELLEETGLVSEEVLHAGYLFQGYGYSTQGYHIFVARGLNRAQAELSREEQDLLTAPFSLAEIEEMITSGRIKDATTVAVLGLLRLKGVL
ncbi:MAG: NUDIX hydrolase [Oricola sp.]